MKFKIGQRVKRQVNIYDSKSKYKLGTVIECYEKTSKFGCYPELYKVQWDNGITEGGFLPHGLDPV